MSDIEDGMGFAGFDPGETREEKEIVRLRARVRELEKRQAERTLELIDAEDRKLMHAELQHLRAQAALSTEAIDVERLRELIEATDASDITKTPHVYERRKAESEREAFKAHRDALRAACMQYSSALSRIDHIAAIGPIPDGNWVSGYDLHCDEELVVESVEALRSRCVELEKALADVERLAMTDIVHSS